jgi:hypothetical protein
MGVKIRERQHASGDLAFYIDIDFILPESILSSFLMQVFSTFSF